MSFSQLCLTDAQRSILERLAEKHTLNECERKQFFQFAQAYFDTEDEGFDTVSSAIIEVASKKLLKALKELLLDHAKVMF